VWLLLCVVCCSPNKFFTLDLEFHYSVCSEFTGMPRFGILVILGCCTQLVQECNSYVLPWRVSNNISYSNDMRFGNLTEMDYEWYWYKKCEIETLKCTVDGPSASNHISVDETAITWRTCLHLKESAFIFSYSHTSQVCYINIESGNFFHCFDRVIVMHL